ncbi:MAG: pilus assembly protein TadG-related protein, partial [Firmicutes bacterium]|nr:pilus assembly protein TadG-related protein [Bacillota bacterium]
MREYIGSEKGSIMPIFAVVVTALIVVMAVAIDFSRYVLVSEKLNTASVAFSFTITAYVIISAGVYFHP